MGFLSVIKNMANPQIENGYTKIANELLDALSRTPMRGELWRVIMFVIRKTYGFNKVCDRISLSQFELGTGMDRRNLRRALKEAGVNKTLLKTENGYKLNKNYNQWLVSNRPPRGVKDGMQGVSNVVKTRGLIDPPQKKLTKEIYKRETKKLDGLKNFLEDKKIIK